LAGAEGAKGAGAGAGVEAPHYQNYPWHIPDTIHYATWHLAASLSRCSSSRARLWPTQVEWLSG